MPNPMPEYDDSVAISVVEHIEDAIQKWTRDREGLKADRYLAKVIASSSDKLQKYLKQFEGKNV